QQVDIEYQRCIRRNDTTGAACAVAHMRRNDQGALAANFHAGHTLIPAPDDLLPAEEKDERLAAIHGAVEFFALAIRLAGVVQPTGIVHGDIEAGFGFTAIAHHLIDFLEFANLFVHSSIFLGRSL